MHIIKSQNIYYTEQSIYGQDMAMFVGKNYGHHKFFGQTGSSHVNFRDSQVPYNVNIIEYLDELIIQEFEVLLVRIGSGKKTEQGI
jgi:hypothetical protein